MVSKSFVVCRLLGGTGRRVFVPVVSAKPPALLCPATLLATASAIAPALVVLAA